MLASKLSTNHRMSLTNMLAAFSSISLQREIFIRLFYLWKNFRMIMIIILWQKKKLFWNLLIELRSIWKNYQGGKPLKLIVVPRLLMRKKYFLPKEILQTERKRIFNLLWCKSNCLEMSSYTNRPIHWPTLVWKILKTFVRPKLLGKKKRGCIVLNSILPWETRWCLL